MTLHEVNYAKALRLYDLAYQMKLAGMKVDLERRAWHLKRLDLDYATAETTFRQLAGDRVAESASLENPKIIQHLFYTNLGVPPKLHKKTGRPTLDKDKLRELRKHPDPLVAGLAKALTEMRQASKTIGDLRGWTLYPDGYVHPNFNPYAADTWRWSSSDPNMQQRLKTVRGDKDPITGEKLILRYGDRDCFVCEPDEVLIEADYSQLEARNLALFSDEPSLMQAFQTRGFDVHSMNAQDLTGQVTKRTRDMAKKAMYGMQNFGTAETLFHQMAADFPDLVYALVEELVRRWNEKRPRIREWQIATWKRADREKLLLLPFSGKVYRFYLNRVEAPTVIAELIQGSAADIVNEQTLVLIDLLARLPISARLKVMLQIHDAIMVRCKREARDEVVAAMRKGLETTRVYDGREMNYFVDVKAGQCWEYMEEIKYAA